MESNWSAEEKENVRNKEEIKEFIRTKMAAFKDFRLEKELDVENDFISYADVATADFELRKDEDLLMAEMLSLFANITLPIAAMISSGVAHIINNKEVLQVVMNEISQTFGEGLSADELSDRLGSN